MTIILLIVKSSPAYVSMAFRLGKIIELSVKKHYSNGSGNYLLYNSYGGISNPVR
ncbi:MAG: hypothetical protein ACOC4R_00380 [Bacteroidota bacterium]